MFFFVVQQSELAKLRQTYDVEYSIWRQEHEHHTKRREAEKEIAIRNKYREERDTEIDKVVNRFDADALQAQQDFDNKIL